MTNISAELTAKLQKIADDDNALVMSFIAPDTIIKTSPVSSDYARIKIQDLYAIEKIIEDLKEKNKLPEKLYLVIHTPGGGASATTKIARYLQCSFKEINAFVPYQAASGGTVLCLTAKCIVMGDNSNLTPIDPQIRYHGMSVSVVSYEQAIEKMKDKYSTKSPEELPSPDQQMSEKFDPIIANEFAKMAWDALLIAIELLNGSQDPKTPKEKDAIIDTAILLSKPNRPHSHQINVKRAKEIGLTICQDVDKMDLLKVYKEWVSALLNEKETNHIILTYIPNLKKGDENNGSTKTPKKQGSSSEDTH